MPSPLRRLPTRLQLAADAAEKAPGSVDAPIWAIVVGEWRQEAYYTGVTARLRNGTDTIASACPAAAQVDLAGPTQPHFGLHLTWAPITCPSRLQAPWW